MYRNGKEYDQIAQLAIQLYLDYDLKGFPLDEREVCQKLGITLKAYSEYTAEQQQILEQRSHYGFFVPLSIKDGTPPTIFYNDTIGSRGCQRQTILHEIKHYVSEDAEDDPSDDDLAEYFGKYIACPIPYLIACNITSQQEIMKRFNVSYQMAGYIAKHVHNRIKRYGYRLFDYELPLIYHLAQIGVDELSRKEVMPLWA